MFQYVSRGAFITQSEECRAQGEKHQACSLRHACPMLFVVAVCLAVLMPGCIKDKTWKIGEKAPEISALDLNNRTVRLSDFKGKLVVVRFWSSGCSACVAEMPVIDEFGRRYSGKGMVILAVNIGDSKEAVQKFVGDLDISFPVLLDPALIAAKKYGVRAVPTTFVVDRDGIARKVFVGETTHALLDKAVAVR